MIQVRRKQYWEIGVIEYKENPVETERDCGRLLESNYHGLFLSLIMLVLLSYTWVCWHDKIEILSSCICGVREYIVM